MLENEENEESEEVEEEWDPRKIDLDNLGPQKSPKTQKRETEDFKRRNTFKVSPFHPQDGNPHRSGVYGILNSHFTWVETLGQGSFAEVKHGRIRKRLIETNGLVQTLGIIDYAVKIVNKRTISVNRQAKERISAMFAEKHSHMDCDHPFILKMYDTMKDKTNIYFILELCGKKDLCEIIRSHGTLPLHIAQYYLAAIVDALEYLHGKGYVHRDLKPENIMLTPNMRPRLGDFGCVRIIGENVEYTGADFTGTPEFMSPESIFDCKNVINYPACDIYSLGPLLFYFLEGKHAFHGKSEYLTFALVKKAEVEYSESLNTDARDLIEKCIAGNPDERPSLEEVKSHPFFQGIDWNTLQEREPPLIEDFLEEN